MTYKSQCVIGLIILLGIGLWLNHQVTGRPPTISSSTLEKSSKPSTNSSSKRICIDVKGAVNRPGIYYLSHGSRVQEAIDAAGGQSQQADLRTVNLAKELQDQQMIYIPAQGEKIPMTSGGGENADTNQEKVNINTANKEQLQKLDGIGDKKADKIIEYRQQHGEFKTADDLKNVNGFGDKTVARLKDQIAV